MKRNLKFLAILSLALLAFMALAAPANVNIDGNVRWMKLGAWVGTTAGGNVANKLTAMLGNSATYDAASITATCTESTNITVTGAKLGDVCSVGAPTAVGALNISVTCYVFAADAVRIKVCNPTAGAIDPASGTYYVRVFSNQ